MGNRAVITTRERKMGVYLHWNGGRDSVGPLLKYCEMKGYRSPSHDCYGWARLCQVIGNFFGGTLSVGIAPYTTDRQMNPGDNGIYVIDGWEIADHLMADYDKDWNIVGMRHVFPDEEERGRDFSEMLRALDERMPESERLGEYLDAVEVPVSDLELGDEVWMREADGSMRAYPVIGFGNGRDRKGRAYVKHYDHDGDYSWNTNNYPQGKTCRIKPRR